jgi:hypothetical protein
LTLKKYELGIMLLEKASNKNFKPFQALIHSMTRLELIQVLASAHGTISVFNEMASQINKGTFLKGK